MSCVLGFLLEVEAVGVVVGLVHHDTRVVVAEWRGPVREFELLSPLHMRVEEDCAGRPEDQGNPGSHGYSTQRKQVDLGVQHRKLLVAVRFGGMDCKALVESLDHFHSCFAVDVVVVVEWEHR